MQNISDYLEKLNTFMLQTEYANVELKPEMNGLIVDLCTHLRMAEFSLVFYKNLGEEKNGCGEYTKYSELGSRDEKRTLVKREVTGGYAVAVYTAYQHVGDPDWTEEEKILIQGLMSVVYVYHSRLRLIFQVNKLYDYNMESGFHNGHYFRKWANMMKDTKGLSDYGACFFNIKNMSLINRQVGRDKGDVLLRKFAQQFRDLIGDAGAVGHLGGDNFLLLFPIEKYYSIVSMLAESKIVYDEENDLKMTMSAIAGFWLDGAAMQSGHDIMDKVCAAYSGCRNTKQQFVYWGDDITQRAQEAKAVENDFKGALEKEEYLVYYQPKVSLNSYKINGAEALCRWFHEGKIVPPAKFIPALEQTQNICTLDFYMLEHVCQDVRRWLDEGKEPVPVSVNLSRKHVGDTNLVQMILEVIDRYRLPHELIEIELTETVDDENFVDLRQIVSELDAAGISTSVDDFGVGYSSLNLISELPWKTLKLDKSFLDEAEGRNGSETADARNRIMLKYVIAMAHELGIKCIAEGVETEAHVELLKSCNCFNAQGFHFWKPLPKIEFEKLLSDTK